MANLDPVIGSEQGGVRPVVIIQNDKGNRYGSTVIVAAMTGQNKKPDLPTHVLVPAKVGGLEKDTLILLEQVRTIEKTRLGRYLGTLPRNVMEDVSSALRASLACSG